MKKVCLLLAFISLSVFFVGCSKDDDNQKFSIVGTWGYRANERVWIFSQNNTYVYYFFYKEGLEPTQSGTYTFDGVYLALDGGFKKQVEFSEDGKSIIYDGKQYNKLK